MSSPDDSPTEAAPEETVREYATRDQLRAMAHPLRMRIIERVGRRGTARAADLAEDLDIPANSVSYHLRTLARGGVVVEAPEAARDKRDRVWKLVRADFRHAPAESSPSSGVLVDHDYVEASGATTMAALEWMRSAWVSEIAQRTARFPETAEQRAFAAMFSAPLRLSREQARELFDAVQQKLEEYVAVNRDEHGADRPGDPDSGGDAQDVRMLFTMVGERPHATDRGADGDDSHAPGVVSSSSTASPASRA